MDLYWKTAKLNWAKVPKVVINKDELNSLSNLVGEGENNKFFPADEAENVIKYLSYKDPSLHSG